MEMLDTDENIQPCICPEPVRGSLPDEFLQHVQSGNLSEIQAWLDREDVNAATLGGQTLLSSACVYQRQDVVDILLQDPRLHLNTRHRIGTLSQFTPLCIAAKKGLNGIVSSLLGPKKSRCCLDLGSTTLKGKTALRLAAENNHWETVECLCPYESIPASDASLVSNLARLTQRPHIVEMLNNQLGRSNRSPAEVSVASYERVYTNNTSPRGMVLILNYKFASNPKMERKGTEADAEKLQRVFSLMDYKTEEHSDLSLKDTHKVLREFSHNKSLGSVSCAVVIIMSHGLNKDTFSTADDQLMTTGDLLKYFTDKECPHLKDKPKIFLLQFCRGSDESNQVKTNISPSTDDLSPSVDALRDSLTNIVCIYATQEGFNSYRFEGKPHDPFTGTPFIKAFSEVLESKGHILYLDDLLREFIHTYSNTAYGQPCEFTYLAFKQKFCFNPPR